MDTLIQNIRHLLNSRNRREAQVIQAAGEMELRQEIAAPVDICPNDPIIAYFLSAPGALEIDKLHLDSPALQSLKAAGVKLSIPLVSQGELVGLLNLGPRLSEQDYSTDDRVLLNSLAIQAAPAIRVAQMVREHQVAARERERIEQELRVARLIQQTLLPKDLPALAGWKLARYYQPAREVGGDFYDFISFDDGRLGVVIGDVTDKGVPAALVMATTRSMLRTVAQRPLSPGKVLERVNNILCAEIPPKMFVTCLYAILDPASGQLLYANAGHDLPYWRHSSGVSELRATGMPLGLMPEMSYEEKQVMLTPGDFVLFYSDGLVEAHNPHYDMFGFPRLARLVEECERDTALIGFLLDELSTFTGPEWEQEDDVTLVALQRSGSYELPENIPAAPPEEAAHNSDWRTLDKWTLPSEPGNERGAIERVARAVQTLHLPPRRLEQLKTAVAEATMNAMEHGNHYMPDKPVSIVVMASDTTLSVSVSDSGGTRELLTEPEQPDLEAKLAELQTPRGWGLFLIKHMVDDMHVTSDPNHHTIELIMHLEGDGHGSKNS
ncbi:MAG TPA: SpoIIE family protein phosphatase [Ktedonobacteraceae bacterium]|nr:SpoIIE family protein phosphatase [Ktedonobacteraceae bacterium]